MRHAGAAVQRNSSKHSMHRTNVPGPPMLSAKEHFAALICIVAFYVAAPDAYHRHAAGASTSSATSTAGPWTRLSNEDLSALLQWLNPQGRREGPLRNQLLKAKEGMQRLRKALSGHRQQAGAGDSLSRKASSAVLVEQEAAAAAQPGALRSRLFFIFGFEQDFKTSFMQASVVSTVYSWKHIAPTLTAQPISSKKRTTNFQVSDFTLICCRRAGAFPRRGGPGPASLPLPQPPPRLFSQAVGQRGAAGRVAVVPRHLRRALPSSGSAVGAGSPAGLPRVQGGLAGVGGAHATPCEGSLLGGGALQVSALTFGLFA